MINNRKEIKRVLELLEEIGLPYAYYLFKEKIEPPFVVYYRSGQVTLSADDTHLWSHNTYIIEYYFKIKESEKEEALEKAILDAGFQFSTDEDEYIEDEDIFVIYYYLN